VEVGAADEVEVEVVEVATVDDEDVVDDDADDEEDELDDAGAAATALKTLNRQLPPQLWEAFPEQGALPRFIS
jgi:hypothetical protein